jgi:pyruvate carboxylase
MKMETTVSSNHAGKVKSLELSSGSMVKQDDLIVILE